jgi:thiosulfate/3-mercaptopyruvate sulfurtransferase
MRNVKKLWQAIKPYLPASRAVLAAALLAVASLAAYRTLAQNAADAWPASDVISINKMISAIDHKTLKNSNVYCVGFEFLYRAGHIPGSVFAGPASEAAGLAKLQAQLKNLPRTKPIIIYCGCCPFNRCPNVRPAYHALKAMGFRNVKVVEIDGDFQKDWVGKGYPYDKSK